MHECTSAVHECTSARVHERTGVRCTNATADAGSESRQGEKKSTDSEHPQTQRRPRRRRLPPSSKEASNGEQQVAATAQAAQAAQREQQASSKQRRATSSEGEAVQPSLDCLNGEDRVLSTGKEVFLVVDHSLNVLHGVVGLNLEGRGLTVAVLRKICIPLRGWSVE